MRIHTALADEPKVVEPCQETRVDLGPLSDQNQHFAVFEPLGEHIHVFDMIVPNRDVERRQLGEARQRLQGVEVVIQKTRAAFDSPSPASNVTRPSRLASSQIGICG